MKEMKAPVAENRADLKNIHAVVMSASYGRTYL